MSLKTILAALAGGAAVLLILAVIQVVRAVYWRPKYLTGLVLKRRLGSLNPFGSSRDLLVFSCIVLGFSCVALGFASLGIMKPDLSQAIFLGSFCGAASTMSSVFQIRCAIEKGSRARFVERLAELGYFFVSGDDSQSVYLPKTPRWSRWDSNRVIILGKDDSLEALCPLLIVARI